MAKITREQYNKFNEKCKNGFSLDLQFFATWNEKRCIKTIQMPDDVNLYEVIIEFTNEYKNFAKIGVKVEFIVNKCVPTGTANMYSVHELKREEISDILPRKSAKILQERTNDYTEEKLIDMIKMLAA